MKNCNNWDVFLKEPNAHSRTENTLSEIRNLIDVFKGTLCWSSVWSKESKKPAITIYFFLR